MSDSAPVAVVTGASRGAGRGIATALAERGWHVYGTGRSIDAAPAWGVGVRLDHRDDDAVGALFARVDRECGRLDLLVNNAAAISDDLVRPEPFWCKPRELADVLDVVRGLAPRRIVDAATLTGACMVALGYDVAGLFSNDQAWCDAVAAAADHRVRIPIRGRAESLNLAAAAAVCLYASERAQAGGPGRAPR